MTDYSSAASDLEMFLRKHVPLADAAEIKIDSYTGEQLVASAPLDKNINDKGTAFGGSLYNLCVVSAWGMAHLKTGELGLEGDLVVAKGEISYLRPLREHLIATAKAPDNEQLERVKLLYQDRGLASFYIDVTICDDQKQLCAEFRGKYAIIAPKRD